MTRPSILLIDDSPGERELFRLALAQTGLDVTLYTEQDSDAAFHFLDHRAANAPGCPPGEVTGVVSTARIERGPSQAARSASTETMPVASPSLLSARVARAQDHAGVVHSEPSASTETLPPAAPSLPSLILLDLHLGRQNGCDLLKRLRSDDRFAALPVVIFTTSDDPADLAHSYSCGTNGYVVKPGSFDALVRCTTDLCRNWLTWNRPSMSDTAC